MDLKDGKGGFSGRAIVRGQNCEVACGKRQRRSAGFCGRTEGGIHTGKGVPEDSCQVGVPSGVNIVARRFIVDENIGAVVAFCTFGVGGLPDTHLFRVEKGKLRFVHTLTHVPEGRQVGQGGGPGRGRGPGNQK